MVNGAMALEGENMTKNTILQKYLLYALDRPPFMYDRSLIVETVFTWK